MNNLYNNNKNSIKLNNRTDKDSKNEKIDKIQSHINTNTNSSFTINSNKEEKENKKKNKIKDNEIALNKFRKKFFITNDGQKGKNKNKNTKHIKIQSASINKRTMTENNKLNDSFNNIKNKENHEDDLYQETLLNIKNRTLNNYKLKSLQKKLRDLEFSKNRDKLIKTNGFNGKENLLINIKDIMKEVYIENPRTFTAKKK